MSGAVAKPVASLSLDLDDEWTYLLVRADQRWREKPSYLSTALPRILELLTRHRQLLTFFIVGSDAAVPANRELLQEVAEAGHAIGNHSQRHEPWLHRYARTELDDELARSQDAIECATARRPVGFRGPGYSLTPAVLEVLIERGFTYDASTLPTVIGPLSRAFYFRTTRLSAEERDVRNSLFGTFRDGLRPLRPYRFTMAAGSILELPVTTMPLLRMPIHMSYLLWLSSLRAGLGCIYLEAALRLCSLRGVAPSFLLHPLDFMDAKDVPSLAFFPAMNAPASQKLEQVSEVLERLSGRYDLVTTDEHAWRLRSSVLPTHSWTP